MKSEVLIDIGNKFNKAFGSDYEKENENKENKYSIDENKWMENVEENTVQLPNGHYQINPLTPRRTLVAPFTKISILF